MCVLQFFFDAIFASDAKQIIGGKGEKEIDVSFCYLFIVEDEGLHPESADILESIDEGIIHECERIQDVDLLMHALQLYYILFLVLVDNFRLFCRHANFLDCHLQTDLKIQGIDILPVNLHFFSDLFLRPGICPF